MTVEIIERPTTVTVAGQGTVIVPQQTVTVISVGTQGPAGINAPIDSLTYSIQGGL
jgi:hypothetical protein